MGDEFFFFSYICVLASVFTPTVRRLLRERLNVPKEDV